MINTFHLTNLSFPYFVARVDIPLAVGVPLLRLRLLDGVPPLEGRLRVAVGEALQPGAAPDLQVQEPGRPRPGEKRGVLVGFFGNGQLFKVMVVCTGCS